MSGGVDVGVDGDANGDADVGVTEYTWIDNRGERDGKGRQREPILKRTITLESFRHSQCTLIKRQHDLDRQA